MNNNCHSDVWQARNSYGLWLNVYGLTVSKMLIYIPCSLQISRILSYFKNWENIYLRDVSSSKKNKGKQGKNIDFIGSCLQRSILLVSFRTLARN